MKKMVFMFITLFIGVVNATAQIKTFVAKTTDYGQLSAVLGDQANDIDSLVVEGKVNADDFYTMWSCGYYGKLSVVNLEGAEMEDNRVPDHAFFHYGKQLEGDTIMTLKIRRVMLPEGITAIDEIAFGYMLKLEDVNLPSTLLSLGDNCFVHAHKLGVKPIVIPEKVTEIPNGCFKYCYNLRSVTFPKGLKKVGPAAFYKVPLESADLPDGLEEIGEMGFCYTALRKVDLPGDETEVKMGAFMYCDSLREINIPNTRTTIPSSCFNNCMNLEQVIIPSSIKEIGSSAFSTCPKLRELVLHEGLKSIGHNAFEYCALDSLVLPSTVEYLAGGSFIGDQNFTKIYSKATVPPVCNVFFNRGPFYGTDSSFAAELPIYVPVGTSEAYKASSGWDYFSNYIETEQFPSTTGISVTNALGCNNVNNVRVYANEIGIVMIPVNVGETSRYAVYSASGALVSRGNVDAATTVPCKKGMYVVRVGKSTQKVMVP